MKKINIDIDSTQSIPSNKLYKFTRGKHRLHIIIVTIHYGSTIQFGKAWNDVRDTPPLGRLPAPDLVVGVKHENLGGLRLHLPQIVQVMEAGTHTELDAACLLKETTSVHTKKKYWILIMFLSSSRQIKNHSHTYRKQIHMYMYLIDLTVKSVHTKILFFFVITAVAASLVDM